MLFWLGHFHENELVLQVHLYTIQLGRNDIIFSPYMVHRKEAMRKTLSVAFSQVISIQTGSWERDERTYSDLGWTLKKMKTNSQLQLATGDLLTSQIVAKGNSYWGIQGHVPATFKFYLFVEVKFFFLLSTFLLQLTENFNTTCISCMSHMCTYTFRARVYTRVA